MKKQKRILITVHQYYPEYSAGTEALTRCIADELKRASWHVNLLTMRHADAPLDYRMGGLTHSEENGIVVWRLEYNFIRTPEPLTCEFSNPYMDQVVEYLLDVCRPDVVHIMHTLRLSGSVIDIYKRRNLPVVMTMTDFWFLCPRVQMLTTAGKDCCGPSLNATNCIRCMLQQNNHRSTKILRILPLFVSRIIVSCASNMPKYANIQRMRSFLMKRPVYLRDKMNRIDRILVPTLLMRNLIVRGGAVPSRIQILPFCLPNDQIRKNLPPKRFSGSLRVGFIGTIIEHKGLHLLIQAFRDIEDANANLLIYGDMDTKPSYSDMLRSLSGDDPRIQFMGTFPNDQIGSVMDDIDVLVVPSIWYENMPLVILSAFTSKVPVIATDTGGLTEMVKHGGNGLTFPKGNVEKLRQCIEQFYKDPTLLQTLSRGIKPVPSAKTYVRNILAIYASLGV